MSEGEMLYLILAVAAFLIFTGTLMWAMVETSPNRSRERTGASVRRSTIHQH